MTTVIIDGPDGATRVEMSELDDKQLAGWARLGNKEALRLLLERKARKR